MRSGRSAGATTKDLLIRDGIERGTSSVKKSGSVIRNGTLHGTFTGFDRNPPSVPICRKEESPVAAFTNGLLVGMYRDRDQGLFR